MPPKRDDRSNEQKNKRTKRPRVLTKEGDEYDMSDTRLTRAKNDVADYFKRNKSEIESIVRRNGFLLESDAMESALKDVRLSSDKRQGKSSLGWRDRLTNRKIGPIKIAARQASFGCLRGTLFHEAFHYSVRKETRSRIKGRPATDEEEHTLLGALEDVLNEVFTGPCGRSP